MIRKVWAEKGDAAVYNIARLAIGLNPAMHMLTRVGSQDQPTLTLDGRVVLERGALRISLRIPARPEAPDRRGDAPRGLGPGD